MTETLTLRGIWMKARAALGALPADEAKRDARLLIQDALRLTPAQFLAQQSDPIKVPEGALEHLEWMIAKRAQRMPISHIQRNVAFWGRDFEVTGQTLAPRADTETLIAAALDEPFEHLLDLGTGTGCLAITLLAERKKARGVATDISPDALAVAQRNAVRHRVEDRLDLMESSWCRDIRGRYDLVVSNPPYIDAEAFERLAPEVRLYEPKQALTPGPTGLEAYRIIISELSDVLAPGGRVILEIGFDQAAAVSHLLQAAGLSQIETRKDLSGKDRVVLAKSGWGGLPG